MAIIQHQSQGLDRLFQSLISKQEMEAEKERVAIARKEHDLRVEAFQQDALERKAADQAALKFLPILAQALSPQLQEATGFQADKGQFLGGVPQQGAAAYSRQLQEMLGVQDQLQTSAANRDVARGNLAVNQQQVEGQLTYWDRAAANEARRIDIEERRETLASDPDSFQNQMQLRQLDLDERTLEANISSDRLARITQTRIAGDNAAVAMGINPTDWEQLRYGTNEPAKIDSIIAGEVEMDPAKGQELMLTRLAKGMGFDDATRTSLKTAIIDDGMSPQMFLTGLWNNEEVEDETKSAMFMLLSTVYDGLQLPPQVATEPSRWSNLFRWDGATRSGTRLTGRTGRTDSQSVPNPVQFPRGTPQPSRNRRQ